MQNVIRIVAAVVDTRNLTLYKENGETLVIPQGDVRVRRILDAATPQLISQGFADVDVTDEVESTYLEFEEKSNGVVKLFRIAKSKLTALLAVIGEEIAPTPLLAPTTIGTIPAPVQATLNAVEEILQHAVPVSSPAFHEEGIAQQGDIVEDNGDTIKQHSAGEEADTIIAVTGGKIIPGMEKIKTQFGRAAKLGSTVGIENFLRRVGSVIDARKHSVEDLLKFMERGDLPIADDGTILIYKVLNRRDGNKFVDCHSKKVEQWVGAYVCMDASLVDHNRSNECSNGLHVARRGYVKEFRGDVCVLAKLAPEDVIAVPSYDANKMRVCGYHIIAELSKEQYDLVRQNKPITDDAAGKVLLGKALQGDHIGQTHEVRITGQMGQGVKVTELRKPEKVTEAKVAAPVAEALANPSEKVKDAPIDPRDVIKQVEVLSRKDIAAKLYADGDVAALKAYKKSAKVSWDKLGVPDPDVTPPLVKVSPILASVISAAAAITPQMVSAAADAIEEFGEDELERFRDEQEAKKHTKREINGVVVGEGSPRERIQKLLSIGLTSVGVAQAVLELKKKSKKSWSALGVSEKQMEDVLKLA